MSFSRPDLIEARFTGANPMNPYNPESDEELFDMKIPRRSKRHLPDDQHGITNLNVTHIPGFIRTLRNKFQIIQIKKDKYIRRYKYLILSPDLNINDLGFFASLKVDVKRICTHCTSREEMMVNVMKAFEEYPREKIDGIWACWYNNLRSVMACDGGNDYKQAHNGCKRRQRETGSACDYTVNLDDYDRCVRLCR